MSRGPCARLRDIIEHVDAAFIAEAQLELTESPTSTDVAFDAILYDLIVIGEAVKALPPSLRAEHPDVDWTGAAGMRDMLAHRYFGVRAEVVHATLDEPLLRLRNACELLLAVHCPEVSLD